MIAAPARTRLHRLRSIVAGLGPTVVAFSGGTDSSLVAAVATRAATSALAVTAVSPSLPPGEADSARRLAAEIGIEHRIVRTREAEDPRYLANGLDRCYRCKLELYGVLREIAREATAAGASAIVVSGANVDDLGDFRPGLRAAEEHGVRHPLIEAGMGKADVREAARSLGLSNWDKPASACLSSRIAFGERITVEELSKVGRAERLLHDLGFRSCRARVHGDLVRVEVDREEIERLAEPATRERIVEGIRSLGYRYVTLDLEGFRSGSMNPDGS